MGLNFPTSDKPQPVSPPQKGLVLPGPSKSVFLESRPWFLNELPETSAWERGGEEAELEGGGGLNLPHREYRGGEVLSEVLSWAEGLGPVLSTPGTRGGLPWKGDMTLSKGAVFSPGSSSGGTAGGQVASHTRAAEETAVSEAGPGRAAVPSTMALSDSPIFSFVNWGHQH